MYNSSSTLGQAVSESVSVIDQVNAYRNIALNRFSNSNTYSELHEFYNGYASACEDVLKLLKTQTPEVVEAAKKSHKLRKTVFLAGVGVGIYLVVKKQREKQEG